MNEKQLKTTLYCLVLLFDIYITLILPGTCLIFKGLGKYENYFFFIIPILAFISLISFASLFILNEKQILSISYYEKLILWVIFTINLSLYLASFIFIGSYLQDLKY